MTRPHCLALVVLLAAIVPLLFTGCATEHIVYHDGEMLHGNASWYGPDFDGKMTADGETFDMRQLTAAHLHLPFDSIVRVTNVLNGKSVEVRINDRGPYEDDRIIDVSSAAADILQMKGAGVVPVEIEVLSIGDGRYHRDE